MLNLSSPLFKTPTWWNKRQALSPPFLQADLGYADGLLQQWGSHAGVDVVATTRALFTARTKLTVYSHCGYGQKV
jgi:hypothetical protein